MTSQLSIIPVLPSYDECNRAWLFNGKDSKSVMRFDGDSWSIESLPHQLPLDVETYFIRRN